MEIIYEDSRSPQSPKFDTMETWAIFYAMNNASCDSMYRHISKEIYRVYRLCDKIDIPFINKKNVRYGGPF